MRFLTLAVFWPLALALGAAEAPPHLSRELQDYLRRPEAQMRVLGGALLVCKHAYPELDLDAERKDLLELGRELKSALAGTASIAQQADGLARFLFEKQQFGLPQKDDAAAFLLSDVLRNKRGNCLGLSVLCLALAEETGLKLQGVPVPSRSSGAGHLLVRFDDGITRRNFDPTEKGAEHPDAFYQQEFKLGGDELRSGYVLGNAKTRDVLAVLLVNLGGAYVEERRAAEAVPLLEAALVLRADSAAAQSNLAAARLSLGDSAAAEKAYAAALRIDPKFFPARVGQADLALRKGDAGAAKLIDILAAAEPDNVQARTLQASLQLQRNDLPGALKTLNEMAALPSADVSVWNNLGKIHALSGDMALSEVSYRRALVYDERSADAHCGLGRALLAAGKQAEAEAEFDAALKIDPHHSGTRAARGESGIPVNATAQKPPDYPHGTAVLPFKIVSERIFVSIRLNDARDVDALIDTGTEITLLNTARVKLDGLRPISSESLVGDLVGRVPMQMVVLDALKAGEITLHSQPVGRIDQGAGTKFEQVDFVLGMDVLSKMRFTLDFTRSQLALWPAGSKPHATIAEIERIQVPLVPPPGASALRPYVAVMVNQKHPATFLVDTGADAPMFVAFKKPSEMGFVFKEGMAGAVRMNDGVKLQELPFFQTSFTTLEIGKSVFREVGGRVIDASSIAGPVARQNLAFLNVLGTPFLKTFAAVHFDLPGRTLTLDRARIKP